MPAEDLSGIAPELWLLILVLVLLAMAPFTRERAPGLTHWLAIGGVLAPVPAVVVKLADPPHLIFEGTYAVDQFALVVKLIAIAGAVLTLLATRERLAGAIHAPTVPALVVATALGSMALAASVDLVLIALFLQVAAVASYALVGVVKEDGRAHEATLKYFLVAASAGAVMLYGMALLFALTGTLSILEMAARIGAADRAVLVVSLALFLSGFAFKVTAVPLHWWAPDTYQGATAPIAGFLSVVPKIAGLAVAARTVLALAPGSDAALALGLVAAGTMTVGNVLALRQSSVKRLLAYSSIAQAGFVLVAVAAIGRSELALPAFGLYLIAYLAMNLAAFLVVGVVERASGSDSIERFSGLGGASPALAAAMALLLLSLAGVPPLIGFVGKVALLLAALEADLAWLAVVLAVNAAVAVAYYLRVIAAMYFEAPSETLVVGRSTASAVHIGAAASLLLGLLPAPAVALAVMASALAGR